MYCAQVVDHMSNDTCIVHLVPFKAIPGACIPSKEICTAYLSLLAQLAQRHGAFWKSAGPMEHKKCQPPLYKKFQQEAIGHYTLVNIYMYELT